MSSRFAEVGVAVTSTPSSIQRGCALGKTKGIWRLANQGDATPNEVNTSSGDLAGEDAPGVEIDLLGNFPEEVRDVPSSTKTMLCYQTEKGNKSRKCDTFEVA